MHALQDLYIQNPFWIWLAVGAVFVALDIASGSGKLIWGGVAAAAIAFINLADVRLGAPVEIGVFALVAVGGMILVSAPWRSKPATSASRSEVLKPVKKTKAVRQDAEVVAPVACADRTGRLIGRIGRTTGEFANGVGRVWIDGSEWGAELDGEDILPPETPVRVMGVTGGVRLQVRGIMVN
jgi:membrane protein implicated in regulation of membrane protease activity